MFAQDPQQNIVTMQKSTAIEKLPTKNMISYLSGYYTQAGIIPITVYRKHGELRSSVKHYSQFWTWSCAGVEYLDKAPE